MKKILFIGPFPPPITGNSIVNVKIINLLPKYNFNIKTINTSYSDFKDKNGVFSLSKLFFYLKLHINLYKILNVDIVYISIGQTFFGVLKNGLAVIFSRVLRKKIVFHLHGNEIGYNYNNLSNSEKKIFKYILSKANKAIVLSEGLRFNMELFLPKNKVEVVPNFVDSSVILSKSEINNKDFKDVRLLYLSNLMTEKGIFELLESLLNLQKKGIYLQTEIFGEIDTNLIKRINQYLMKLENHVKYLGVASNKEKRKAYFRNNVFILPSYNEGVPLSILEAMGTGNMIITTNLIGLQGILKDGENCMIVDKKNSKDLEHKLEIIYKNIREYKIIGMLNYNKVIKEYSEKQFILNLSMIFNEL